jgi:membrane-associated phospholipid phosphatase
MRLWAPIRTALVVLALLLPLNPGLEAQKTGVQRAGDVLALAIPATGLSATLALHDREGTKDFFWSLLTITASTQGLKLGISRERPDHSDDNSFPSGHTSTAFQGASFIHLRYGFFKGLPAYAAATFVGLSRVYADKHFLSDVVAGAALGTLSSCLFTDRFEAVEVIPASEMGRYGLEIRIGLGSPPRAR